MYRAARCSSAAMQYLLSLTILMNDTLFHAGTTCHPELLRLVCPGSVTAMLLPVRCFALPSAYQTTSMLVNLVRVNLVQP